MKLINKYIIALIGFVLLAVSCEDEIKREPSPNPNPNSSGVYFSNDNSSKIAVAIDATGFSIVISREKTDGQLSVNLLTETVFGDIFSVPQSVTFAAGEAEKEIEIGVSDKAELMKSYYLSITINDPDHQPNPYAQSTIYPRIELNIVKEDFAPYATGIYESEFFEEAWQAVLEYSPATGLYRFSDCWMPDYHVLFAWDQATDEVEMQGIQNGDYVQITTGYVHPTYGMVYAFYSETSYDRGSSTFTFPIQWRVILNGSWASFGSFPDSFTITQALD